LATGAAGAGAAATSIRADGEKRHVIFEDRLKQGFPKFIVIGDVMKPLADLGHSAQVQFEEIREDPDEDLVWEVVSEEARGIVGAALEVARVAGGATRSGSAEGSTLTFGWRSWGQRK
jgi:hypothetical protein